MIRKLEKRYSNGKHACLLNVLSSSHIPQNPFAKPIKDIFKTWINAFSLILIETGEEQDKARQHAEQTIMLVQGSLVLSRGLGSNKPFRQCMAQLRREFLSQG